MRYKGKIHERICKAAGDLQVTYAPPELYLTANVHCPAVLVECGFMSNNFEVLKLKESGYQSALALVIAASYLEYISESSLG